METNITFDNVPNNVIPFPPRRSANDNLTAVHGFWSGDSMLLWAETDVEASWRPGRPGRRPSNPVVREHPYAADSGTLLLALREMGLDDSLLGEPTRLVMPLPSVSRIPSPSRISVLNGRPDPEGVRREAPWSVDAIQVEGPAGAANALSQLMMSQRCHQLLTGSIYALGWISRFYDSDVVEGQLQQMAETFEWSDVQHTSMLDAWQSFRRRHEVDAAASERADADA